MPSRKGYIYVGAELRDELVREIDALDWSGDDYPRRAEKVKTALVVAAPYRKGYLIGVHNWDWQDYDFLKMNLVDGVEQDLENTAASRGIALGDTFIGRQIRALRDKL